ncbi:hypothetical protein DPMN_157957 [Dreissena polymorpha]|uniref:Uncharacterized protein n=1 Tax=Dreissena polymorpha TaxID=45954 RepID=A0A9D4EH04_DREPO|nr:hypothetical protein DPMN_157957 [Dreissena polymorpha]
MPKRRDCQLSADVLNHYDDLPPHLGTYHLFHIPPAYYKRQALTLTMLNKGTTRRI